MIGHGRPTISALVAAVFWLAGACALAAQETAAPSDSLRIIANRDPLIFGPREQFVFDVEPLLQGVEPSTSIDIATTLTPARGKATLWSTQQRLPVPVDGPAIATLHVPMPAQEGVYEIRLAVTRPSGFRERFFPGANASPLVERAFQVVVLDRLPKPPAANAEWRPVMDIDPANPAWSTRLPDWTQIRRIPGLSPKPIGTARTTRISLPSGTFVELPPTPSDGEPHWQAFPLTVESLNTPHMLEVEYPNDREQHLGVSIVEPDGEGSFTTIGRDSGVYVEGLGATDQPARQRHHVVFWPRTNAPLILLTNQHPTAAARFGHIRVFKRSASTLAIDDWATDQPTGRLVAAYIAQPIKGPAAGPTAPFAAQSLPASQPVDWHAYFSGAHQLAEYLNYSGFNAAAVNVLTPAGSLLPPTVLQSPLHAEIGPINIDSELPTPDGLELMLRMFDRAGLALVPTLDLAMPLRDLEVLRHQEDAKTTGIELIGPGGLTWAETHSDRVDAVPHYNLLDDRVQRAVLAVVEQLVQRYGRHRSFRTLAVRLSNRGYAALPDLAWGIDDATVARFERETGIHVAPADDRFAARQAQLTGNYADQWRTWRAARLSGFYQQLAQLLRSGGSDRRLLLTTEDLLATHESASKVRPNVVAKARLDRTMLDMGIDWHALGATPGVVVLPTRYVESMLPLVDRAIDLSINDAFSGAEQAASAALFYHRPQHHSFSAFDALSPFSAHAQLLTQSVAHGATLRKPYIAAIVEGDPALVIDGGEQLPLGQENEARALRKAVRELPLAAPTSSRSEQNLTVRTYTTNNQTICVVVNECPWTAEATLNLTSTQAAEGVPLGAPLAGRGAEHLTGGDQVWSLQLAPYDIYAVRFNSLVTIQSLQSRISESGQQELATRVAELKDRDLTAVPQYAALSNPSFEAAASGESLPGWQLIGDAATAAATLDNTTPQEGQSCLHLKNSGPGVATVESHPFPTPPTGQLLMWAFVRGENVSPETDVRLVFEVEGKPVRYRQVVVVGGNRPGSVPLTGTWGRGYAFGQEDLPLNSRSKMRIKFELRGPGEIWVDNVQLYDLLFPLAFYKRSEQEKLELVKVIRAADKSMENGDFAECARKLDAYWPRFLNAYTPAVAPTIATQPTPADNAEPTSSAPPANETPSVGSRWLPSFWRH